MTTTVLRATSSPAFLALVPHLLECTPRRSLVVVPFDGGRSLGAMRVDLPPQGDDPTEEGVASTVVGMACKVTRTDAVAIAVYTDSPVTSGAGAPHTGLVDAVRARADICGLRIVDALVVGSDGWASYLEPSAGPRPLTEIRDAAFEGLDHDVSGDHLAAARLPAVSADDSRLLEQLLVDVEHALRRSRDRRRLSPARRTAADAVAAEIADPPGLFESTIARPTEQVDMTRIAALAFCLERPALRDVALMQWTGDLATGDAVFRAQTAFRGGEPMPEDLARPLWGEGAKPDPARLRAGLELCRRVASLVGPERRPGALAACAWLAWASGRSTHAAFYADAALAIDGTHGLSEIMRTMLDAGRLPEWVFERSTSPAGRGSSRGSRVR
ncbi:hypothetical protein FHS07_000857 [Microbacterium proteolyticum]|uniref:Lipopolysaccharide biosynthesis protein n=1 Tax=Microbacterium proteolyticum TaxID=1572644 RepID=A0A7W5CGD0_9MICO|nr:DUF4192 family protein [Microbacterium proteolyticum]MBB3157173.1 hypothetical protein [Microbacterium proteolyticum]